MVLLLHGQATYTDHLTRPHAVDSWKLSKDPAFVDKVRDLVGLYMSPPENALVLAVDEKSQVQALDRAAPILPMMPTTPPAPRTTASGTAPPGCSQRWTSSLGR